MQLHLNSNAEQFSENLNIYARETGKTISEALAREGPDFAQELYTQFRTIHPNPQSIRAAAKSRLWHVRRMESSALVPTEDGLSERAVEKAKELLGGQKSELFRPGLAGLLPIRFSARAGHRRLQGGRTGFRFAKSALRGSQLTEDELTASLAEDKSFGGVKRLNLQALSIYYELLYRGRGAQGGTMAVQWLFKTWRKGSSVAGRLSQLVQRSQASGHLPIGTVDFEFTGDNLETIVFKGLVPGTGVESDKHGILDRVYAQRAHRLLVAVQMHVDKVARTHGL